LFHTSAAIGVVAIVIEIKSSYSLFSSTSIKLGFISFVLGIVSHGILDIIPHCYPINSKLDAIVSFLIMLSGLFLIKKRYRFIVGMAFLGSVFPDVIDLSPQILNKYLGFSFSELNIFFLWHRHDYSGSIYDENCNLSTVYQIITVVSVVAICFFYKGKLRKLFT
jgi:hypothetical protein